MVNKPKALLKHSKGKARKKQVLDDADDYLAAAVDDEDAMGKWRAGDGQKSLRFANAALALYQQGLFKYPRNFDLAYNKARLELEIATHPLFLKVLDVPVVDVLQQSLTSHRYALSLDPDNADTLFNTATVLTTIAEIVAKDDNVSDLEALDCLEQALECQGRCLQIQEVKYAESRQIQEEAGKQTVDEEDDDGGAEIDANTRSAYEDQEEEERWVSVIEPVTGNSLIDTLLAQLGTLTTLCSIVDSSLPFNVGSLPVSLPWVEEVSSKILEDLLPSVISANTELLAPRASEIALTKANFLSSLLELAFRSSKIDTETYETQLDGAFSSSDFDNKTSPEALLAYFRAIISFNSAVADFFHSSSDSSSTSGVSSDANIRWNALGKAQKLLTTVSTMPSMKADSATIAQTHFLRGDTSLLLHALADPPAPFPQARSNAAQLLKNAHTFYRNATKLFGVVGQEGKQEKETAEFRGMVVEVLQSINQRSESTLPSAIDLLNNITKEKNDEWKGKQLQDMLDEGLVRAEVFGV